ncbi:ABC transporter substrate-binding protein [Microbacterium sp. SA39]|uniref:ABC transporter substrate-binding protein n=1 Tax=Microbacterium sp. SA39 TaxID=1263625 RepID=UPI0005FA3A7D|nr:ABC transporter substrate-binding protein [Microbacterium sp. SA39]KJQ52804.1 Multiple sugar-binding protein precursor [Microbacterium sp. SA39]
MSKKTVRIIALTAAASSLAIALAGCSGAPETPSDGGGKPLVYLVPSSWANYQGLQENIDAYTEKTGVEVEVQGVPDEQYDQNVRAKISSGGGVDIFAGLNEEKDPGSFMTEISDPDFQDRMSASVFESMLATDGKLYGVPAADGLSTFGVFYNKDVFETAGVTETPETLEDLTAAFTAVKESGVTPLFLSGKDGWTLLQHRNAVNADFIGDNAELPQQLAANEGTWTEIPGFEQQYQNLADWAKGGLTNADVLTASYEQSTAAVADGTAGAIINGSWVIGEIRAANPEGNFGFFALPNPEGTTQIALSQPNIMHIAKDSAQPEAARELLEFLIEPAQVENFLASTPGVPAFTDVTVGEPDPIMSDIQIWVDDEKTGAAFDTAARFPTPQDDIIAAYQELLAGRIDVAEFGTRLDTAWQAAGKTAGLEGF